MTDIEIYFLQTERAVVVVVLRFHDSNDLIGDNENRVATFYHQEENRSLAERNRFSVKLARELTKNGSEDDAEDGEVGEV